MLRLHFCLWSFMPISSPTMYFFQRLFSHPGKKNACFAQRFFSIKWLELEEYPAQGTSPHRSHNVLWVDQSGSQSSWIRHPGPLSRLLRHREKGSIGGSFGFLFVFSWFYTRKSWNQLPAWSMPTTLTAHSSPLDSSLPPSYSSNSTSVYPGWKVTPPDPKKWGTEAQGQHESPFTRVRMELSLYESVWVWSPHPFPLPATKMHPFQSPLEFFKGRYMNQGQSGRRGVKCPPFFTSLKKDAKLLDTTPSNKLWPVSYVFFFWKNAARWYRCVQSSKIGSSRGALDVSSETTNPNPNPEPPQSLGASSTRVTTNLQNANDLWAIRPHELSCHLCTPRFWLVSFSSLKRWEFGPMHQLLDIQIQAYPWWEEGLDSNLTSFSIYFPPTSFQTGSNQNLLHKPCLRNLHPPPQN